MDVEFRRLLRHLVWAPGGVDWSLPWHDILHSWNERVRHCCERFGMETLSTQYLRLCWRLASYIALLPSDRWVKHVLQWDLHSRAKSSRAKILWDDMLVAFGRWHARGHWTEEAARSSWRDDFPNFDSFCRL